MREEWAVSIPEWTSKKWFGWVHGHNLVYNACWEDPRLDRIAMELSEDDTVLVITSAGCNALDYVLDAPQHVYAVDMNPRQNALLELKMAGIRNLDFETFFAMFGQGQVEQFGRVYESQLRGTLSETARAYWDRHQYFFTNTGARKSFYFHGTSGYFAWLVNQYLNLRPALREGINALLSAQTVEEQQDLYFGWLHDAFWNGFIRWVAGRDTTLSLLGVPRAQRQQVERHYDGGIAKFMEDCIEAVLAYLPVGDNYFWRVYLTGQYTRACCPEYLKEENFYRLRDGLVDRVSVHTNTVQGFLEHAETPISRYVLLDHMDWLSSARQDLLQSEWQAIVNRAAPNARILWRSGGLKVDFVDPLAVSLRGAECTVGDILRYNAELAAELHPQDRVHTYGSFYIADLATA